MQEIIVTILVILGIFTGFYLVTDAIGRAVVYSDNNGAKEMDVCLSSGISYEDCFSALNYSNTYFAKMKKL